LLQRVLCRGDHVEPAEDNLATRDASSGIQDTHHGIGQDRFAGAALPDNAYGFAARDLEMHLVEGIHGASARTEFHCQILDDQERHPGLAHVRLRGSMRSRRPSPKRLKQNTASINTIPGNRASHHSPETMNVAPSATMMPHSGVGGRTPRPMNDRPAALRIAQPMLSDTCTIMGGRMLGIRCTTRSRASLLPQSRAASTKPALRRTLTSDRARRA